MGSFWFYSPTFKGLFWLKVLMFILWWYVNKVTLKLVIYDKWNNQIIPFRYLIPSSWGHRLEPCLLKYRFYLTNIFIHWLICIQCILTHNLSSFYSNVEFFHDSRSYWRYVIVYPPLNFIPWFVFDNYISWYEFHFVVFLFPFLDVIL